MILIEASTTTDSIGGPATVGIWSEFADQLNALVCGSDELEQAGQMEFRDTLPAVCWAVPGAYANAVDC